MTVPVDGKAYSDRPLTSSHSQATEVQADLIGEFTAAREPPAESLYKSVVAIPPLVCVAARAVSGNGGMPVSQSRTNIANASFETVTCRSRRSLKGTPQSVSAK